jgi:hypothetical protein
LSSGMEESSNQSLLFILLMKKKMHGAAYEWLNDEPLKWWVQ